MGFVNLTDVTSGYKERLRRLALFDPLYDLDRKRERDQDNQPIDMKGLGLLTLLFFFEQKLLRHYKTSREDVADFLKEMTNTTYRIDDRQLSRLVQVIIETFRPQTGVKRQYTAFDWETKTETALTYSILKSDHFDREQQRQYYTLDEDGLELIFATKEFYSEFQLSINQLMLRKQLEKGEYKGALRQINEMRIDVESLDTRLDQLKHEISRSIISEETFERYKQLLDDIYLRLEREEEEFQTLRQFVLETKDRLYAKDLHIKEHESYGLIIKIASELESVHYTHTGLLNQTWELKNTTLVKAQESIYYTGVDVFNFDTDINAKIFSEPLPLEAMTGVFAPFLQVETNPRFSPLTFMAEQAIIEQKDAPSDVDTYKIVDFKDDPYLQKTSAYYEALMQDLLEAMTTRQVTTLSDYIDDQNTRNVNLYQSKAFYHFFLILHQRSPITHSDLEDERQTVLTGAIHLLKNQTLSLTERPEIIRKTTRYSIQDFTFKLTEGTADAL